MVSSLGEESTTTAKRRDDEKGNANAFKVISAKKCLEVGVISLTWPGECFTKLAVRVLEPLSSRTFWGMIWVDRVAPTTAF